MAEVSIELERISFQGGEVQRCIACMGSGRRQDHGYCGWCDGRGVVSRPSRLVRMIFLVDGQ